jgi:hypothetical protein
LGRDYYDDVLNVAIKYAGHDLLKESGAAGNSGDAHFSREFEKTMKSLIGAERRKRGASKALKAAARVAAALLILAVVSTAVIFSSEALRTKVLNMFYSVGSDNASVESVEVDENNIPVDMVVPGYMPSGYDMSPKIVKTGGIYTSKYVNSDNNTITLVQKDSSINATVDSDGVTAYATNIKGVEAFVSENVEKNIVLFNYGTKGFLISGKIDVSELVKIAESIIE